MNAGWRAGSIPESRISGRIEDLSRQVNQYPVVENAQAELSGAPARQFMLQKKFAGQRYANSFATIQESRMQGGFCSEARVIYAR